MQHRGIVLVGKIFENIGFDLSSESILSSAEKNTIRTLAGLLIQGRTNFAEVDLFRHDPLFKKTLNLHYCYAPETIQIYLDRLAKEMKDYVLSTLNTVNLNLLQQATFSSLQAPIGSYLPVDIDVSPMGTVFP